MLPAVVEMVFLRVRPLVLVNLDSKLAEADREWYNAGGLFNGGCVEFEVVVVALYVRLSMSGISIVGESTLSYELIAGGSYDDTVVGPASVSS